MNLYRYLLRPILFSLDPEAAHNLLKGVASGLSGGLSNEHLVRFLGRLFNGRSRALTETKPITVAGIEFQNSVGLAAGFDKDCEMVPLLSLLGFGHIELGTVTPLPQPGNPRPRILRLPDEEALINRMGFPSHGVEKFCTALKRVRDNFASPPVLGVNVGKNKETKLEDAYKDYVTVIRNVRSLADYLVINISSPNTPELRQLQSSDYLVSLLGRVMEAAEAVPLFVKIAPDLSEIELREILEICIEARAAGVVATNTTVDRTVLSTSRGVANSAELTDSRRAGVEIAERFGAGGISGKPLQRKALPIIERSVEFARGRLAVIGVGGISTSKDAQRVLNSGASLVQVYTGLIYNGPRWPGQLINELALERMGEQGG